jgi:hypothetical protein
VSSVSLSAQETITYSYDALGRLVQVYHGASGPNANTSATYTYDRADNRAQVVVTTSAITITVNPATLPNGTVGTAYNQTITATGGAPGYTFTATGTLPAGLSLSSAGVLSGTPTTAGTSNFTVTATDSGGNSGTRSYSMVVSGGAVTITLSPANLASGTVGAAYSQTITASGGTSPYTFTTSAGTLPAGLTLTSGGVLSGTPTTAGTSSFTVQATDSASHSGTQSYNVTVTLALSPATLAGGTVGSAYSQTITASGGTSPYTFAVTSGSLPAGLTLSSGGVLSGTPTTAAAASFTVQASDTGANHIGSQSYSVTIGAAAGGPVANPDSASTTVCGTVSVNVIANDTGTPPLTLTAIVSSTKGTATVESSTNVSYTAFGTAGTGLVTYTVSDGNGATANGTLSINISGGTCQ